MARERQTVLAMIRIYCRGRHEGRAALCDQCERLQASAMCRLDRCPFGDEKPTCSACPIHCYRDEWRDRIRQVMGYAGPRMLWRHPLLALRHWLDGSRAASILRVRSRRHVDG
jgi:hypothetical protein